MNKMDSRVQEVVIRAIGIIKEACACFNGDLAHAGDGILGIDTQVGQDLVDLVGVHQSVEENQGDAGDDKDFHGNC